MVDSIIDALITEERFDCPTLHLCVEDRHDDDELCEIFKALKQKTTVGKVCVECNGEELRELGEKPALSLAATLAQHPTVSGLCFKCVERMSGFSAIALAIQQNENLSSLGVHMCVLTRAQMADLEWLLAENALDDVEIDNCFPEDDILCVASGLRVNKSLKKLSIVNVSEDSPWEISRETIEVLPVLLRANNIIQSICLEHVTVPPEVIVQIAEASSEHRSLTSLSLCAVGRAGSVAFLRLLKADWRLEKLNLSSNDLSDTDGLALSSALRHNTSLKRLELEKNRIGPQGAAALANVLSDNSTLKELHMHDNPIGNAGAAAFARALTNNATLSRLIISHFSEPGLNAFSSCLPSMNGLKNLHLRNINGLSSQNAASQFLEALKRNTELEHVYFCKKYDGSDAHRLIDEIEPKMELQMTLNRAGKRILKSESHVPDSLWPLILAKSSKNPDALYFFLCEKPDVLINKPPPTRVSRKRKRGWFGGWF